jgi:hypothetical protein
LPAQLHLSLDALLVWEIFLPQDIPSEDVARRRDNALRKALNTPPQPKPTRNPPKEKPAASASARKPGEAGKAS